MTKLDNLSLILCHFETKNGLTSGSTPCKSVAHLYYIEMHRQIIRIAA